MASRVTPAERTEMVRLYQAQRSTYEIADELGRAVSTVRGCLGAAGVIALRPPGGLTDGQIRGLVADYVERKMTIRACATEHGLPPDVVRKALVWSRVPLRPAGRASTKVRLGDDAIRKVRLGDELIRKVDVVRQEGESRAAAIRRLLAEALA